jgi:putative transposase
MTMYMNALTAEQVHSALQDAKAGSPVTEVCRTLGVSEATFLQWRRQFDGFELPELRELHELQHEVRRLKRVVAELSADKRTLSEAVSRLW